jgi:hypothetical protein
MNENIKWGAAAVAVVGLSIGAVVYRDKWWTDRKPPPEMPVAAVPAKPVMPEEPAIKHPLPEDVAQTPLPSLDESDEPVQNALADLIGKESADRFIISKDVVRHIVVSIDNLSTEKLVERIRPVSPVPGKFVVRGADEALVLDPSNYERYKPLVQLFRSTDTKLLVATYTRYYPLFQDAYANLGHPPEYFNDRVIEVIDHLLETPDLRGPVALAQPSVQYEFADQTLESRSAGQKALLRMGSENATAIKHKLRELRVELTAKQPAN